MIYSELSVAIEKHVAALFEDSRQQGLWYHNFKHATKVVDRVIEISCHYSLTPKECFIVTAAAWFHDTGHAIGILTGHERVGVELMMAFFSGVGIEMKKDTLDEIAGCIMATRFPPAPNNILQQIICDADTYHFGTDEFLVTDKEVRMELEYRTGEVFQRWYELSLNLLRNHTFYTNYCASLLAEGKAKNIGKMESLLENQ